MNDPAEYIMGNMIILNKNQMIIHGHLAMSMALVLFIYSNSLCLGAYVKFKHFLCYLYWCRGKNRPLDRGVRLFYSTHVIL